MERQLTALEVSKAVAAKTRKPDGETKSSGQDLSSRKLVGWSIWLFLLVFAYYYLPLTRQADFYISDTSYFFEPFAHFVGAQLKQGLFPAWNPLLHCGISQLAVPSPGLFYPFSYLLFFLPFSQGLSLYMIFHQMLFALGGYLYLRQTGMSRSAAILGAISLGLSSYCFALTRNPTLPATIAWFPLSLYLQTRITGRLDLKQVALCIGLSLTVFMTIAAGRPEIFATCIVLLIANCFSEQIAALLDKKAVGKVGKVCLSKLVSVLAGVGMAGPVILPALEWSALSARAHGLAHEDVLSWSANGYDFVSMLLSFPLGDVCALSESSAVLQNLFLSKSMSLPFLCSSYIGPVILSFSLFAFCSKEFKGRFFLLGMLLLFCVLAAGSFTPLAPLLLKAFPALSVIRYPVKLLIFPALILCFAAAFGFDLVLKKKTSNVLAKCIIGLSLSGLLVCLLTFCFPLFGLLGPQYLSGNYGPILRAANLSLANSMAIAAILGIITAVCCLAYQKDKLSSSKFSAAILVLASTALFLSSNTFPYLTKAGFYNAESSMFQHLSEFLDRNANKTGAKGRILPFYADGLLVPEAPFKIDPELSYEERFYAYSRAIGRFNTAQDFSIPQGFGYEGSVTAAISSFYKQAREYSTQFLDGSNHPKPISDRPIHRFCQLSGAEYLLTQASLLTKDLPLPEMDDRLFELYGRSEKNNSRIYTVLNPRPRIHFAKAVQLVDSWDEFESIICNPEEIASDKSDADYLLKSQTSQALAQFLNAKSSEQDSNSFKIETDNGQSLVLWANCKNPALLVIQDSFYPGWKAEIDGASAEILNANLFGRAVSVPAGKHKIKLYFAPDSLKNGMLLSFASILLLLGALYLLFVRAAGGASAEGIGEPLTATGKEDAAA